MTRHRNRAVGRLDRTFDMIMPTGTRVVPEPMRGRLGGHDDGEGRVRGRDRGRRRPSRRAAADPRQRADVVPGAGADPLAGGQRRPPVLLHQLRAAGVVPRHRAGLPDLAKVLVDPALHAGAARPARGLRAALPGLHRPRRRRPDLLHRARDHRTSGLGDPAAHLRADSGRAGRAGRGRGALLRSAAAAHGVPLGPRGLPDRDQPLHRAVVPLGALGRLGLAGGGRFRPGGLRSRLGGWPWRPAA